MADIRQIGVVGVDSGQLIMCDPCYLENEWQNIESSSKDFAHDIYECKIDGKFWQYAYGGVTASYVDVTNFPGNYEDRIPEYGKTPNQLIKEGLFVKTDRDKTPHIEPGEFSYRGACKATLSSEQSGQLNFKMGHEGAGVVCSTGLGDGLYPVYAEFVYDEMFGRRIKKVWVEFM